MKKSFIYTLFSLAFVLLFSSTVSADIIPPNSHSLDRCVKIVNLNDFSDVVLISYITGPMVQGSEINQIKNSECLSKGYKFNSLKIYWNTKDNPNSIDQNNLLLDNVEVYGGYVDQSNPLIKESIEYSIAGFSGGKLILYKSKQTSEYNNGSQKKIETFNSPLINQEPKIQNPQPNKITPTPTPSPKITPTPSDQPIVIPTPEPVRRGFWQSISCFFSGLFGRGCR
ncbi:MAG: hypothetical protein UW73_C0020G0022 [Microgenomates group bacterium GW2011_GWB1_44_8]|nr:MAG: hypothetical protein UW73_C0020G0022 [Microgenomates group bacterium GW2011_GWB1_44_8]